MHQICQHDNCLNFSWYAERLFVCALGGAQIQEGPFQAMGNLLARERQFRGKPRHINSSKVKTKTQKYKYTKGYFVFYTHICNCNYCGDPYQVISIYISIIVYHVGVDCCPRSKSEKKVFLSEEKV